MNYIGWLCAIYEATQYFVLLCQANVQLVYRLVVKLPCKEVSPKLLDKFVLLLNLQFNLLP